MSLPELPLRSARLRRLVTALLVALSFLVLLERLGAAGLRVVAQDDPAAWRTLGAQLVAAAPEACWLLALVGVRRALGEFADGRLYAATVTALLHRVGLLLALGAFLGVFAVPGLQRALGAGPPWWIAFDVSALVLGALGLTLTVVAGVLGNAAVLQAELDEIF